MRAWTALLCCLPLCAAAQEGVGAQVSLVAGVFKPASAHGAEALATGGLVLGYDFNPDWSIEGLLAETAREDGARRSAVLSALSGRWHPWQREGWRPELFLEAGRTGFLDTANTAARYNSANAGVGLKWFAPRSWFARADLRLQHTDAGTDAALFAGAGLYFAPRAAPPRVEYDSDGDGISDERDTELAVLPAQCPACAAPDPCQRDSDLDGVTDCKDACPATPAGSEVGLRGCPLPVCGEGGPDADGDGVPDCRDVCPRTPSGLAVDASGCVLMTQFPLTVALDVKFDFDRSEIKDLFNVELGRFRLLLVQHPELSLELEGHADARGSEAYNLKLSEARARAVRAWLLASGEIEATRISLRPYGKARPMASNETEEGRAQNRRVSATLRILSQQPQRRDSAE